MINLRAERINRGLSLDDLAERTGVAKSTLARVERRESIPSPRVQYAIATHFGLRPTDVWPLEQEIAA